MKHEKQKESKVRRRLSEILHGGTGRFSAEPFDPATHYPVIRSSICTGEKTAGFKNRATGHFTEVMLIRNAKDLQEFKETYHVDSVETEY